MTKPVTLTDGYYRQTGTLKNGRVVMSGPYTTRDVAWCVAYANNELNERKSDRKIGRMIDRNGEYLLCMESRYLQEDLDNEECETKYKIIPAIKASDVVFPSLLNADGTLSH
jgi:hypothetical protein